MVLWVLSYFVFFAGFLVELILKFAYKNHVRVILQKNKPKESKEKLVMNTKDDIIKSIITTTADYYAFAGGVSVEAHIDRWLQQFDESVQLPLLTEIDYVLKTTYFSKNKIISFLRRIINSERFAGQDPCAFWKSVNFLDIQGGGTSQKDMLSLFSNELEAKYNFKISDCCSDGGDFIYLDDFSFTGSRIIQDIKKWIVECAPQNAKLHIITIAKHAYGNYYTRKEIKKCITDNNKDINFTWWNFIVLEDRKSCTNSSDVLRPTAIPDNEDLQRYIEAMTYKPHLRNSGNVGGNNLFSSNEGRELLEQVFLTTGIEVRKKCPLLPIQQRPLGYMSLETLGFGSMIVTYRNCPNNAPLALWADDPWYPLFKRNNNERR